MGETDGPLGRAILTPDVGSVASGGVKPVSESQTNYLFFENREALVLSGGGARAAYQVGVLKAVAAWMPEAAPCPFEVLVGMSAGAINAAALVAGAGNFPEAVRVLDRVWANFTVDQVVRVDPLSMLRGGLHWLLSLLSGGWLIENRNEFQYTSLNCVYSLRTHASFQGLLPR